MSLTDNSPAPAELNININVMVGTRDRRRSSNGGDRAPGATINTLSHLQSQPAPFVAAEYASHVPSHRDLERARRRRLGQQNPIAALPSPEKVRPSLKDVVRDSPAFKAMHDASIALNKLEARMRKNGTLPPMRAQPADPLVSKPPALISRPLQDLNEARRRKLFGKFELQNRALKEQLRAEKESPTTASRKVFVSNEVESVDHEEDRPQTPSTPNPIDLERSVIHRIVLIQCLMRKHIANKRRREKDAQRRWEEHKRRAEDPLAAAAAAVEVERRASDTVVRLQSLVRRRIAKGKFANIVNIARKAKSNADVFLAELESGDG